MGNLVREMECFINARQIWGAIVEKQKIVEDSCLLVCYICQLVSSYRRFKGSQHVYL